MIKTTLIPAMPLDNLVPGAREALGRVSGCTGSWERDVPNLFP